MTEESYLMFDLRCRHLNRSLGWHVCVLVVIHTRSEGSDGLPDVLDRVSALPVAFARNHDPVDRPHLSCPAGFPSHRHFVRLRVVHGLTENWFRSAIDPLFRSAARAFGPRAVGVILSGALSDGTYGLHVVKQNGGVTIVQDPEDAIVANMPANALNAVDVNYVRSAADVGPAIVRLTKEGSAEDARRRTTRTTPPTRARRDRRRFARSQDRPGEGLAHQGIP
jgi:two-component system, chemotaxis family, protein-glutamate methylesterase/glutaminase